MEDSLYLLNDSEAAQEIAWLAQAQVLHEAIVAFHAQANIDKVLAEKVLQAHTPIPMIVKFVQNKIAQRLDSSLLEDYED
jgi:hypothetical protein